MSPQGTTMLSMQTAPWRVETPGRLNAMQPKGSVQAACLACLEVVAVVAEQEMHIASSSRNALCSRILNWPACLAIEWGASACPHALQNIGVESMRYGKA